MKQWVSHVRKPHLIEVVLIQHSLFRLLLLFLLHIQSQLSLQRHSGKLLYMKFNLNKLAFEAPVLNVSHQTREKYSVLHIKSLEYSPVNKEVLSIGTESTVGLCLTSPCFSLRGLP